ncbi:YraN family protein [Porphyrobacter sp. GA68]|uniref:YraN family protein n=1 Tax=Porphyrobacter sp. GA68 TaxID=2883480 RepID=UPI001D183052|nr:YraN family protein [Porphyrobacter sp. GA68]
MKRQQAEQAGRRAEDAAADYLQQQGWEVLARRRRTPVGEIDLVVRRPGLVAFVEVKWRRAAAQLADAIDERRLSRVAAAAEAVAHDYVQQGDNLTVDVLLLAPDAEPRHIRNAWQP